MKKGSHHSLETKALLAIAHREHIGCDVPGCARTHSGHGLCAMHLKRLRVYGSLDKPIRAGSNKGRKFTDEHKAKISLALVGKVKSVESRIKMSLAKKDLPAHNKGQKMTNEQKMNSGRSPGCIPWNKGIPTGISPMRGNRPEYNGVKFRSSYEVRFAKALDRLNIRWDYEPRRFYLGACSYVPDFYLPGLNAFWEVKGWYNDISKKKTQLFREIYPQYPLVIATLDVIENVEETENGSWNLEVIRSLGRVTQ